jgi:hypothetical protein
MMNILFAMGSPYIWTRNERIEGTKVTAGKTSLQAAFGYKRFTPKTIFFLYLPLPVSDNSIPQKDSGFGGALGEFRSAGLPVNRTDERKIDNRAALPTSATT